MQSAENKRNRLTNPPLCDIIKSQKEEEIISRSSRYRHKEPAQISPSVCKEPGKRSIAGHTPTATDASQNPP